MRKEKKNCQQNEEWRAHLSDSQYISLSLEPKQEKGFGCEPRPVYHGPEWVLSVGENQHLAQAI